MKGLLLYNCLYLISGLDKLRIYLLFLELYYQLLELYYYLMLSLTLLLMEPLREFQNILNIQKQDQLCLINQLLD